MSPLNRLILATTLTICVVAPALAQNYSEGFTFLKAVRERDGAVAERVLSNPGSTVINSRDPTSGEGALHILVRGRDLNWLAFMLGHGARADLPAGSDGSTPLGVAAQLGWIEGAEQLIARGANVNAPNGRGETPLILAVQARRLEIIRLLVRRGADPRRTDSIAGYSALDYARQDQRNPAILRLLETAAPARPVAETAGPTR